MYIIILLIKSCYLREHEGPDNTPPWHAKDRFTGFRWVGFWGSPGKLQNFTNDHRLLIVTAVIWPKYCRFGVKHYIINQSINMKVKVTVTEVQNCNSDTFCNKIQFKKTNICLILLYDSFKYCTRNDTNDI